MPQLGLAFPLEDEAIHNDVREMQLAIERACGSNPALRIVPHLSLKQPFHVKAVEPVERYFDELAGRTEAPEVSLHGVHTFDEGKVIYLDVEHGEELEVLRQEVLADLGSQFRVKPQAIEDDRYHFHVTLGFGIDIDVAGAAIESLRGAGRIYRCRLPVMGLFYYATDVWTPYRRARLKTDVAPLVVDKPPQG